MASVISTATHHIPRNVLSQDTGARGVEGRLSFHRRLLQHHCQHLSFVLMIAVTYIKEKPSEHNAL